MAECLLNNQKMNAKNKKKREKRSVFSIIFLFVVLFLPACQILEKKNGDEATEQQVFQRDLEEIKEKGILKVLTTYSGTSYFLYRGQPMGFEYELLKRFAEHLEVELEIQVSKNIDSLLYQLNAGDVDLVAHGLTITSERKQKVDFTDYLYLTHQVLIQKKPDNWRNMNWSSIQSELVHDAIELIGDTVSVRVNSSYMHRLQNLSKEIGGKIAIDTILGNYSTDKIIKMVVDGEIKYTVADNNIANINSSYYPVLNIEVPISFSQRIGWAVRSSSPDLKKAVNEWLKGMKKKTAYYVIYNKYFKNQGSFRKRVRSEFYSLNNNRISKYDPLIKEKAENIGWDWRLLSSLVYQESRFIPEAGSWAGAKGLMQLMPATAEELGVEDRLDPQQNVEGGTRFLNKLWNDFEEIQDSVQRIKFTMAAYNCGFYHVADARRLAVTDNLDPNVWDGNIENIILDLSYPETYNRPEVKYGYVRGIEPFTYVKQIFERYEHYTQFIEL